MSTITRLCNLALARIGQDPILENVTEQGSTVEEMLCFQFYPVAKEKILSEYDWSFMSVKDHLVLAEYEKPHLPYRYIYAYPSDASQVNVVYDAHSPSYPVPFEVDNSRQGTKFICTNIPHAWCEYQKLPEKVDRFPPLVEQAIVWQLAGELAGAIIKGTTGAQTAKYAYDQATISAEKAYFKDAQQRREHTLRRASEFELARL